jgi:HEPN domain-containing protein
MRPSKPRPGSAADWLRRARSDLALASISLPPDVLYNDLCFHAQQAVEKSLKAVLIYSGIELQRLHDISQLATLLPQQVPPPPALREAVSLTSYAVMARYPGDYEDVTKEDYQEAIDAAKSVYEWAERIISVTER